jgi:predicted ABC-type ATPase
MSAIQHIKEAASLAEMHGGGKWAAEAHGHIRDLSRHVDHVLDHKKKPDGEVIAPARNILRRGETHMSELSNVIRQNRKDDGLGVIPGTAPVGPGQSSRIYRFAGGNEMALKREAVIDRLKLAGFGQVDRSEKIGESPQYPVIQTNELWEHRDGRNVRISHHRPSDGRQILEVHERGNHHWGDTRQSFINIYGGSPELRSSNAKPSKPAHFNVHPDDIAALLPPERPVLGHPLHKSFDPEDGFVPLFDARNPVVKDFSAVADDVIARIFKNTNPLGVPAAPPPASSGGGQSTSHDRSEAVKRAWEVRHQQGERSDQQPDSAAPSKGAHHTDPMHSTLPAGRKWVDKIPGMPEDTLKHHTGPDGKLTPERAALHQKVMDHFTKHVAPVPEGKQPQAVLMMGAPASGKSSMTRGMDLGDFVRVDADGVKEQIPEYHAAINHPEGSARNAAAMVHEESSHLAKKVRDHAIESRKNLLFDGIGNNAANYKKMIADLKSKGYHVTVMMSDLDSETGMARAKARAEKTGRWVPESFIREAYERIPKNFETIAADADNFQLFDNRENSPRKVWSKTDGKEIQHDPEFIKRFRAQHGGSKSTGPSGGPPEPSSPGRAAAPYVPPPGQKSGYGPAPTAAGW